MIRIAPMTEDYLHTLWKIGHRQAAPRWKEFAAPYFDDYQACPLLKIFKHWNSTSGYKKIVSEQS